MDVPSDSDLDAVEGALRGLGVASRVRRKRTSLTVDFLGSAPVDVVGTGMNTVRPGVSSRLDGGRPLVVVADRVPAAMRSELDVAGAGWLDRRVLSDQALYQLELERIFARGWNFMCHDSQIPNVGDYFINYIGEDQVICVRGEEGEVNVLLNTCRHRGNALCRAEQGTAKSFVCSYHGWNYALDGKLIGVPGQSTYFHGDLDRSQLGLVKAAQVDSYLGFWFATMAARSCSRRR